MTQEEFDKAPLLDQILYDETGMLVENHPSIAEAMEKYHQAKLKLLGIANVSDSDHWTCEKCGKVPNEQVTYEETHQGCGASCH
jgi:DNA-binding transcriptional regulator LsrR (DeoR family)